MLPICGTHPTKLISPYSVTKLTLENYAYLYAATQGLRFVSVRSSNAFCAGQRPFVAQGFISTVLASEMKGMPINIFGQHGTMRDYPYVTDLASGIVAAPEYDRLSEAYNLGSGVSMSNLDVVEVFKPLTHEIGCEVQSIDSQEHASDVKVNVLDSTKLQWQTGWKLSIKFEDGLYRTCEWVRCKYG